VAGSRGSQKPETRWTANDLARNTVPGEREWTSVNARPPGAPNFLQYNVHCAPKEDRVAADIKTISDAIIAILASDVAELNSRTVATFTGSEAELAEQGRNLPFVGLSLSSVNYTQLNAEDSIAREELSFSLKVVVEDFRGQGFSLETGYGLLDHIRDCVGGVRLGIEGLAPCRLSGFSVDSADEKSGLAVFSANLSTWQVRQRQ
jgi:hypothetical protein